MRDMLPKGDRSIRNIPVPAGHRRRVSDVDYRDEDVEVPVRRVRRRGRRGTWVLAAVAVVIVAALAAFLLSTVFAGASVTVTARAEVVTPPAQMVAELNAPPGVLSYQSVMLSRSATTTVTATGEEHVERQATGKVTIFNNYSSASQRLIANTRFQAADGKIYRIKDSVDVPGMGSAEAVIYADSAGADYNRSESIRFTIPGFKGDPRFDKFYAQSQGAISGGFIGKEPAVSKSDMDSARVAMQQALETRLREVASTGVPEGYAILPGSLKITFTEPQKGPVSGKTLSITQDATAEAALVRISDLASYIARQTVPTYRGEAVDFEDFGSLSITLASTTRQGALTLALSGISTLVWQYDPNAIKEALLGKPRGNFEQIIESFEPSITKAEARIRPFWQGNFPKDPAKIEVKAEKR